MADQDDSNWGRYLGYGLQTCAGVLLGCFVGQWLDHRFHWEPWGTLGGIMVGVAAGMYGLIREGIRINKQ
jgi:F0F1-type ATP synthase assembly protein I